MLEKSKIVISDSLDPWYNLAYEEYLINENGKNQCTFFLWQNDRTVVIGKNQNPWRECKVKALEAVDGKLARRISGGGAVYHGKGNLNFTFIVPRKEYDLDKQMGVIIEAVSNLGINAERNGRNDMTVNGRKFSGNAFLHKRDVSMHHGTVLIEEDMKNLGAFLQVSKEKIESKGVKSVQSRVVNLTEFDKGISVVQVRNALISTFNKTYNLECEICFNRPDYAEIENLYIKNSSWDWRYGKTMKFDITLEHRFGWGELQIHLASNEGIITKAVVYTDALEVDFADSLQLALLGVRFSGRNIACSIVESEDYERFELLYEDVIRWLKTKQF